MKNTDISVKDGRIVELDKIVREVRQSEEWEAVKMNILEIGIEKGMEEGRKKGIAEGIDLGRAETLVMAVELMMKNLGMDLAEACKGVEISMDEYYKAKEEAHTHKSSLKAT